MATTSHSWWLLKRPKWRAWPPSTPLPRSLRGQFTLALSILSLLILGGGLAAVYALRMASDATQHLARERLARMQEAQDVVQRSLLIERETERLIAAQSLPALRVSHAAIVQQMAALDRVVAGLASADDNVSVVDLHATSQLYRNHANVVATLGERALQTELALALPQPDRSAQQFQLAQQRQTLRQLQLQLGQHADSMVAAARLQSAVLDSNYRTAMQQLADTSRRHQRLVLVLLLSSLLFAWLVAHVFLGRHVLQRLQNLSRHLQQDGHRSPHFDCLAQAPDEIGDMARAVDRFLADRAQLELRTTELTLTREHVVGQDRVLEMIAADAPLADILDQLTRLIESQLEGIVGSVLLLDADGLHLRHGAGPSLPAAYNAAIDGVRIGPGVGSCGTAAHRGEPVVVADIQTDPLWADFRALAALHRLRSCWSMPILSRLGQVLGTFAMYSSAVRVPTDGDVRLIELAARMAGIAIERRRTDERIRHMAHHDELTGLPNRALLQDRMAQAMAQSRRTGRPLALLLLDLDGFKFVNDSYGHHFGDALLVAVARRLAGVVREGDTVARLGGDEFVLMVVDLESPDDAVKVAQKVEQAMSLPWLVDTRSLHASASIGVSVFSGDSSRGDSDGETLLKHADVAMYRAKQQGRNSHRCYTDDMGLQAQQHMELQAALGLALEAQQFELHYQPQIDLRSGRVNAMEALIRWRHPELGMVSPASFIPLAEETGLIVPIGEWVLRTACRQLQAWHSAGHAGLCVAVNVSARQFQGHDVAAMVRRVLAECGLAGRFLELELTESALMLNADLVLQTLRELKTTGVMLALDDFGTGFSSLSLLRRFPIDVIKIDQSFTFDVTTSAEAASITCGIVAMAQSLGMKTVAEGVETEQQLAFMAAQRCDSVQGYYLSRPLPVAAMGAFLAEDRRIDVPACDAPARQSTKQPEVSSASGPGRGSGRKDYDAAQAMQLSRSPTV